MGSKTKRRGKPHGMTYADQLARQRMLKEAAQNAANDTMVQIKADIHAQKMSYIIFLALNDEFQFGESRYDRLGKAIIARSEWYEKMVEEVDEEYAAEKLRQEIERVSHQEVEFVWEKELLAAQKKHENDRFTNYERLRLSKPEKLAATLCTMLTCEKCPGRHLCNHLDGKANGLLKWLEQEEAA